MFRTDKILLFINVVYINNLIYGWTNRLNSASVLFYTTHNRLLSLFYTSELM